MTTTAAAAAVSAPLVNGENRNFASPAAAADSDADATAPVPLSLSGMAHIPMFLPTGIAGGLTQVIQHSIMSCLYFAVAVRPPFQWTLHDIVTSEHAFSLAEHPPGTTQDHDRGDVSIPDQLVKKGYTHVYARHALMYLNQDTGEMLSHEAEIGCIHEPNGGWTTQESVLGCISLYYATKGELTVEQIHELNNGISAADAYHECTATGANRGKSKNIKANKGKEKSATKMKSPPQSSSLPPAVLFCALVESRSVPPTGSVTAVKAEITSMTSVGGSVDDDVKYGALAALHDRTGKYVLDIYSVRGKRYTFDLYAAKPPAKLKAESPVPSSFMQPPPPPTESDKINAKHLGPYAQCLCVTVANHNAFPSSKLVELPTKIAKAECKDATKTVKRKKADDDDYDYDYDDGDEYDDGEDILEQSTKSRLCFTLHGPLRTDDKSLPSISYLSKYLQQTFISLRPNPPKMATALPSEQTLLLDPQEAGRVYLHGRLVATWGQDISHTPALFGMDLSGIPYWHGQICDYDMLKQVYSQMWQNILIDARLMPLNIGGMLLSRLNTGIDPVKNGNDVKVVESEDTDDMDDDDADDMDDEINKEAEVGPVVSTNVECLESQVMQSLRYDPVGISAKALATKFKMEYGADAFPCQAHETDWVRTKLPGWRCIVVPLRVIQVLRRGGYFNVQQLSDDIWFATSRQAMEGIESDLVQAALSRLHQAGQLKDLRATHVVFINSLKLSDPIGLDGLVRFNPVMRQYHVNEQLVTVDLGSVGASDGGDDRVQRANLLALEIAKCCPDRTVLTRYLLRTVKQ